MNHKSKSEKVFYYNFKGKTDELPKVEKLVENGRDFFPYANDVYNIVCWQASSDSIGMILGRRSARDLARLIPAP
jgi:hypothetical protein